MRQFYFILITVLLLLACAAPSAAADTTCPPPPKSTGVAPPPAVPTDAKPDRVELVYFHKQNPCHCMAVVGDNIKYAVENNFKDELASGRVKLTMIVSDNPANVKLVKQYDAMLFTLFVKEVRGEKERIYPVNKIWEMTGDENRDALINFTTKTLKNILEGRS